MSLVMSSTPARKFCCVSARWVTRMVASMPVLNRLVAISTTVRPMDEATSNSSKLKPRCHLSVRIYKVLVRTLVISRNQSIRSEGPGRKTGLGVRHRDADGHHVVVDVSVGQQHRGHGNSAGEIAQTHDGVVGSAENSIRTGKGHALGTTIRAYRAGLGGAIDVVPGSHQTIGPGAFHRLSTVQENAAGGDIGHRGEGNLLRVARGVNALHGVKHLVARDHVFLSRVRSGDGGGE